MPFNVLFEASTKGLLRRISLSKGYGYALFPKEWIVLNEEDAASSKYAYVFEGRNGEKYGVPHFIYFSEICYYDRPARDAVCEEIKDLVRKHSRACDNAFRHQVEARYEEDEDGHSVFVNMDEWDRSFVPGVFHLPIDGASYLFSHTYTRDYLFGAHIVRPNGYDFAEENLIEQSL